MNQLSEFRDVFGMRFVGLIDDANVYQNWRVPNPTAPYPQDYVVDQQGVVQYWSDQFDPQAVIGTIDRLLASGCNEAPRASRPLALAVMPNPARAGFVTVRFDGPARLELTDASGRVLQPASHRLPYGQVLDLRGVAPGVYFLRAGTGMGEVGKLVLQP